VPNGSGPPAPQLLKKIPLGRSAFSQPAFADGYLFVASESSLMAYSQPAPRGGPTRAQIRAVLRGALLPIGRAARIRTLLKRHGYTATFNAPTAGKIVIEWFRPASGATAAKATKSRIVAIDNARFAKAGWVRITIRLTAAGARMLKHARSVTLTAEGTYTPAGASSDTATRTIRLRR
jgi:hypothetical protein